MTALSELEKSLISNLQKTINTALFTPTLQLQNTLETNWFAKAITNQVANLQFANRNNEGRMLQALIYAYQNPSTVESLLRILRALFGDTSNFLLDWETVNGVINLQIENANQTFVYGITAGNDEPNNLLTTGLTNKGVTTNYSLNSAFLDTRNFLLQFIPLGWDLNLEFI